MMPAVDKLCKTLLLLSCLLLAACAGGTSMTTLGIHNEKLAACPTSPNCVSSDAEAAEQQIEPLRLSVAAEDAWREAQAVVASLPGTKIVTVASDYLHAECRSTVFGFVDDLELHLRPEERLIAVRSAARLGYSDFGVNRKRVERLRSELIARGALEQPR